MAHPGESKAFYGIFLSHEYWKFVMKIDVRQCVEMVIWKWMLDNLKSLALQRLKKNAWDFQFLLPHGRGLR